LRTFGKARRCTSRRADFIFFSNHTTELVVLGGKTAGEVGEGMGGKKKEN